MSDCELDDDTFGSCGAEENEEIDGDTLFYRAFLDTVRGAPALYAKDKKKYCGKGFNAELAWITVGAAQVPPLEGPAAKELFYKLRQRFGKEWRKNVLHLKGKSGQGSVPPFVSTWPLYEDCLFLSDHITPRKTKSNYKSSTTVPVPTAKSNQLLTKKRNTSQTSLLTCSQGSPSPDGSSSSSLWNADLAILSGEGSCDDPGSSLDGERNMASAERSSSETTASSQVLAAMEQAAHSSKRSAPPPDSFAKKKSKLDEEFMKTMMEQGKALSSVAKEFGNALKTEKTTAQSTPTAPPEEDPLLISLKYALQSVPKEKKFECLIDLLNIIHTKYSNK